MRKFYSLSRKELDDIITRKLLGESNETIGKMYGVTGRTITNWTQQERYVDRRRELGESVRIMLGVTGIHAKPIDEEHEIPF